MMKKEIYIELLDEGVPTYKGTEGEILGNGLYRVLPSEDYDPEDEIWAYLPGTIVRCEKRYDEKMEVEYLAAVEEVNL